MERTVRVVTACASPAARLVDARPLLRPSADPANDLPAHVRAGSAVRRWGEGLVVVQDDVHALERRTLDGAYAGTVLLPPGEGGRRSFSEADGNKAAKLDLEAAVVLPDGRLVVFGSGSTARRTQIVVAHPDGAVALREATDLYAGLLACAAFRGSELNLEGAVVTGSALRLFQRGNGAARDGEQPINATADLDLAAFLTWLDAGGPPPEPRRVRPYALGHEAGVPYGFTDATVLPDGRVAVLLGAEDSPDTYRDGVVAGCRFGLLSDLEARTFPVLDADGAPTLHKLEGLEWLGVDAQGRWRFVVVADPDASDAPALFATLVIDAIPAP